jgi:hypothetical protein
MIGGQVSRITCSEERRTAVSDKHVWRNRAVKVVAGDGTIISISRLGPALKLLLDDWPVRGPKYREARKVALRAYSYPANKHTDEDARLAFIEAAREAAILVD